MPNITLPACLNDLLGYLQGLRARAELCELQRLLNSMQIESEDVSSLVQFDDKTYKRNLIAHSELFDLLLLCWKPGQESAIHNHFGSVCGFRVIAGEVLETRYLPKNPAINDHCVVPVQKNRICSTSVGSAFDKDIHRMRNDSTKDNLITLHVYSPPLTMETFTTEAASI